MRLCSDLAKNYDNKIIIAQHLKYFLIFCWHFSFLLVFFCPHFNCSFFRSCSTGLTSPMKLGLNSLRMLSVRQSSFIPSSLSRVSSIFLFVVFLFPEPITLLPPRTFFAHCWLSVLPSALSHLIFVHRSSVLFESLIQSFLRSPSGRLDLC